MGVLRVEGARLYYQNAGKGPALVLLHGLGSSSADWEEQIPVFARQFRVIAPDFRGHGASERSGEYRVERFALDVWEMLDRLELERPVLVGHSMGGAVAMQMALDRPGSVAKLVLTNTLPSFLTDTFGKRWLLWSRLLIMSWFGPRRLSEVMNGRLYPRPDQAALREKLAKRNASSDRNAYLETIRRLTRWTVKERVGELTMPVLVLAAEHDFFMGHETDAFVAALPDARVVRFPGTRHGLPLEQPEAFNRAVLEFLAPTAGAPPPGS